MNSIRLSLGKNAARIQYGKVGGDTKTYLSLAAAGPCNKLVFGELGGKQKTHRCEDEEPLLLTVPAKGFTVYWAVENHDAIEVVRITVDAKSNTVDMALAADGDWVPAASANLAVFPNPEYKFYNYRSQVAAKPLNAPKRPRGRPPRHAAETE
jgi:hypothetical protein